MKHRRFSAGEMLFRIGDPAAAAFIVVSGEVEILRGAMAADAGAGRDEAGKPERLGPGAVVGEAALMLHGTASFTCRAASDATVAVVGRDDFLTRFEDKRAVVAPFLERLFAALYDVKRIVAKGAPPLVVIAESPKQTLHLFGATPALAEQMRAEGYAVRALPFHVGRRTEEGESEPSVAIELTLKDERPFNLSRQHFAIERSASGLAVRDIWSQLGTTVNGVRIGRNEDRQSHPLETGENMIAAGRKGSSFVFRLVVA